MICRASEKAAGGKLVRLELEHDGSRILRAKITGDFFLHPEDALGEMEKSIVGMQINAGEPAFSSALAKAAESRSAELVGFSPEILAKLVVQAIAAGESK